MTTVFVTIAVIVVLVAVGAYFALRTKENAGVKTAVVGSVTKTVDSAVAKAADKVV